MQKSSTEVLISNKTGLHARPASLFVREAGRYSSQIEIACGEKKVNAKSILALLGLGAGMGSTVVISAEGEDAPDAVAGLKRLIEEELPRVDGET